MYLCHGYPDIAAVHDRWTDPTLGCSYYLSQDVILTSLYLSSRLSCLPYTLAEPRSRIVLGVSIATTGIGQKYKLLYSIIYDSEITSNQEINVP